MPGTKVEVTYYGKPVKLDSTREKVIEHQEKYTIPYGDNWKESYTEEFKGILDKFEGIREIRFYVENKERRNK